MSNEPIARPQSQPSPQAFDRAPAYPIGRVGCHSNPDGSPNIDYYLNDVEVCERVFRERLPVEYTVVKAAGVPDIHSCIECFWRPKHE